METTNQPEQTKSKTSLLKIFLLIVFFPFTISRLIWKQQKLPAFIRVFVIFIFWMLLIGMMSSNSESTTSTSGSASETTVANKPTSVPTPAITLEQKQADFTNLFIKYNSLSEQILNVQKKILDATNLTNNRESLYLALDSLSKQQDHLSQVSFSLEIPDSLKEYEDLSISKTSLAVASAKFKNSIEEFKKYVNTSNLESLQRAKEKVEFGKIDLNTSLEAIKKVATTLSVDISDPKNLSAKTGTKEQIAGKKIPFELADEMQMVGNASGSYNRTIVISLNNVNENDLKILGEELKEYAVKEQFSFIDVFSDMNAATKIRIRYSNEDKSLSKSDTDLYEKSFVGKYIKSGNVHNFTFCLKGYYFDDCKGEENKRVIKY